MNKIDIKALSIDELKEEMVLLGEQKFKAEQIFSWLHQKRVYSFDDMTNIKKELREKLGEKYYINNLEIVRKLVSKIDGTTKYLYKLRDGNCIETVLMKYKHGNSLCVSSQVGCKMGCKFCASTIAGFVRNLTPSEILDEVYVTCKDLDIHVDSIVLMGIGEPLDNYDNVIKFIKLLREEKGYGLSPRHITLSTCGVVDKIKMLMTENLPITLTISLHAPTDDQRSKIMPINNKWQIKELINVCDEYFKKTGRRVSYEYALIKGENDSHFDANNIEKLFKNKNCHINLIPVNKVTETGFQRGDKQAILKFCKQLTDMGINATIRRELGSDISAACGQLRRETL